MSSVNPKVYSKAVDINSDPNFISDMMGSGYGLMQIDVDFFSDEDLSIPVAATGTVEFKAQTTENSGNVTISNPTIEASNRDYDRPHASGRVVKVTADFSGITGAAYARVEIWRA